MDQNICWKIRVRHLSENVYWVNVLCNFVNNNLFKNTYYLNVLYVLKFF